MMAGDERCRTLSKPPNCSGIGRGAVAVHHIEAFNLSEGMGCFPPIPNVKCKWALGYESRGRKPGDHRYLVPSTMELCCNPANIIFGAGMFLGTDDVCDMQFSGCVRQISQTSRSQAWWVVLIAKHLNFATTFACDLGNLSSSKKLSRVN